MAKEASKGNVFSAEHWSWSLAETTDNSGCSNQQEICSIRVPRIHKQLNIPLFLFTYFPGSSGISNDPEKEEEKDITLFVLPLARK